MVIAPAAYGTASLYSTMRFLPADFSTAGNKILKNPIKRLAYVAHNVAKIGLILRFFQGKTMVFCSGNSQLLFLDAVAWKMGYLYLLRSSKNTEFFCQLRNLG
jgi:hypothetical protein